MLEKGGFAEYVCVEEGELAPEPKNLSLEQAAAIPLAANTALLGLRDEGRFQPGQKVLINRASGGVGTFAVGAFGVEAHIIKVPPVACAARHQPPLVSAAPVIVAG